MKKSKIFVNEMQPTMLPIADYTYADEVQTDTKAVGIYAGEFKPPTIKNWRIVQEMANKKTAEGLLLLHEIVVIISAKPLSAHTTNNRVLIDADRSKQIWDLFSDNDRITIFIAKEEDPLEAAIAYISDMPEGEVVYLPFMNEPPEEYNQIKEATSQEIEFLKIKNFQDQITDHEAREIVAGDNREAFMNMMPDHLDLEEKKHAWYIVNNNQVANNMLEGMFIETIIKQNSKWAVKTKEQVLSQLGAGEGPKAHRGISEGNMRVDSRGEIERLTEAHANLVLQNTSKKTLKEMSSCGGGNVGGFMGGGFHNKKKKKSLKEAPNKKVTADHVRDWLTDDVPGISWATWGVDSAEYNPKNPPKQSALDLAWTYGYMWGIEDKPDADFDHGKMKWLIILAKDEKFLPALKKRWKQGIKDGIADQ